MAPRERGFSRTLLDRRVRTTHRSILVGSPSAAFGLPSVQDHHEQQEGTPGEFFGEVVDVWSGEWLEAEQVQTAGEELQGEDRQEDAPDCPESAAGIDARQDGDEDRLEEVGR